MNDSLVEQGQPVIKADNGNIVEPRTTYETRAIIGKIYEKLPSVLRGCVTSPNWVLTVAGARGLADSGSIPFSDRSIQGIIEKLNSELERYGIYIHANYGKGIMEDSLSLMIENLHGFSYVTSHSRLLSYMGVSPYVASTGREGLGQWQEKTESSLTSWAEQQGLAQGVAWDIYDAICYGYPDRAIADFIAFESNREVSGKLETVDILSIHPQAQRYSSINSPEYGVSAMSMNSPEIRQHVALNQKILKHFYDTDWMRKIASKK